MAEDSAENADPKVIQADHDAGGIRADPKATQADHDAGGIRADPKVIRADPEALRAELHAGIRADLDLIRKAEAVLSEIDRTNGLIDEHADVLAALRIRIEGGPRKSLEELIDATGDIRGRRAAELDEKLKAETGRDHGDISELLAREPKKGKSLDDLLG